MTEQCQSRGTPTGPPQWCVMGVAAIEGKSSTRLATRRSRTASIGIERRRDRRAPVVGRTSSAECQAPVSRPLAVDDHVSTVGERRSIGESDRRPLFVVERLGRDHHRVDRDQVAVVLGELGGVGLGGPHRPHRNARPRGRSSPGAVRSARRRCARRTGRHVALAAAATPWVRRAGWTTAQWRCEQRPPHIGGGALPACLAGVEPPVVVGVEPELEYSASSAWMRSTCGDDRARSIVPPFDEVAVDRLGSLTRPTSSTVSCIANCIAPRRAVACSSRSAGSRRGGPSTIHHCVRRPEPDDLRFEDRDPQCRIGRRGNNRSRGLCGRRRRWRRRTADHQEALAGDRESPARCRATSSVRRGRAVARRKGTLRPTQTWGRSP